METHIILIAIIGILTIAYSLYVIGGIIYINGKIKGYEEHLVHSTKLRNELWEHLAIDNQRKKEILRRLSYELSNSEKVTRLKTAAKNFGRRN